MVFEKGNQLWKLRGPFTVWNKKDIDIELMKKLYYEKKWNYKKIANFFGFKSKSAIYDRFKKYKLRARDNTDLKTGFKHSEKTKKRLRETTKKAWKDGKFDGIKRRDNSGKNNPMWGKIPWNKLIPTKSWWVEAKFRRLRKLVLKRDNFRCVKCGNTENLHIDHIIPYRICKEHKLKNLQTLCRHCHSIKTAKDCHKYKLRILQRDELGRFLSKE